MKKIKILIADDSATIRQFLAAIINSESDMQVVAEAETGNQAIELAKKHRPDIVTMDIRMPDGDGLYATKMIMKSYPTRIIVVSSNVDSEELNIAFNAIECGALQVIEKLNSSIRKTSQDESYQQKIIKSIRLLSTVPVVRRVWRDAPAKRIAIKPHSKIKLATKLIAIGCSTGGPVALSTILSELPKDFSIPIVIVQHIAEGFTDGLQSWLDQRTPLRVKILEANEVLKPGTVYVAPDSFHSELTYRDNKYIAILTDTNPVNRFKPSVDVLFYSIAKLQVNDVVAALLTGMGGDGANGLLALKQNRCHTLIQDEPTSVVWGMPGRAAELGAEDKALPIQAFSTYFKELSK